MEAFFRFFRTRGHATCYIWCDNGTNLKAGGDEYNTSLKSIDWSCVIDNLSPKGVKWKHILPFSPQKGGSWERLVGMTKQKEF